MTLEKKKNGTRIHKDLADQRRYKKRSRLQASIKKFHREGRKKKNKIRKEKKLNKKAEDK
jgi:hypothetical protein